MGGQRIIAWPPSSSDMVLPIISFGFDALNGMAFRLAEGRCG